MKKMILPTVCLLILASSASAQNRRSRRRSISTTTTSAVAPSTVTAPQQTTVMAPPEEDNTREVTTRPSMSEIPDNRKEYMIDGQLATYTGHQASPINSDEFQSLRKDRPKKEEQ